MAASTPKIACVTLEYPPFAGGVARYLGNLVRVSDGTIEALVVNAKSWWPLISFIRKLSKRFDFILVSHVLPVGTAAWLARKMGGAPYIIILHGTDLRRAQRSWRKRWLLRRILREALAVLTNSAFVADEVRQFDSALHPIVMTPGVEVGSSISRVEARRALQVPADARIILSVARLVPRKGIDRLIEALAFLPADVRLVVIGQGSDLTRLEKLAETDRDRIRFFTDVSDRERDQWYAASDVFALPGRDEGDDVEGLGIVYLEAARAGLPVVAGQSGGVGEAVQDGQTGLLVNPYQTNEIAAAIRFFLDHPEQRHKFGAAGRFRVQQDFRWEDRARVLFDALPLVSVIIPVYDRPRAFRDCLAALAKQTYHHFETVIVIDGAAEDMESIIRESSLSATPIVQRFAVNQGPPATRNEGFRLSHGSLVLFLDADATLRPCALESMVSALVNHQEADFVYADHRFGWKKFRGQTFDPKALQRCNYIHTTSLMRRGAFPGFDPALRRFQDWDLWLTMMERGSTGVWIQETLFTLHPEGTMSRWLPSVMHRLPFERIGWMPKEIRRYRAARTVIQIKHQL